MKTIPEILAVLIAAEPHISTETAFDMCVIAASDIANGDF